MLTLMIILAFIVCGIGTAFIIIRDELNDGSDVSLGRALVILIVSFSIGFGAFPVYLLGNYIVEPIYKKLTNVVLFKGRKE